MWLWNDPEVEEEVLDAGVISVAGDDVPDMSPFRSDAEIDQVLREANPEWPAKGLPIRRGYWLRFGHEMAPGDLVVILLSGDRAAVARVTGAYRYDASAASVHLRHSRTVDVVIDDLARSELPNDMSNLSSMRHTIVEVENVSCEELERHLSLLAVEAKPMDAVERFHGALLEAVGECRKIGYHPSYFLQMLDDRGPVETARHLITTTQASDGFTTLWEKQRLDLSVEAIALRPEFSTLFSVAELDAARRRLDNYGYSTGGK